MFENKRKQKSDDDDDGGPSSPDLIIKTTPCDCVCARASPGPNYTKCSCSRFKTTTTPTEFDYYSNERANEPPRVTRRRTYYVRPNDELPFERAFTAARTAPSRLFQSARRSSTGRNPGPVHTCRGDGIVLLFALDRLVAPTAIRCKPMCSRS